MTIHIAEIRQHVPSKNQPDTSKPLFIVYHGLDNDGAFGEAFARQFSESAPIYLSSGPVEKGEHYELYSPSAENRRWFDPSSLITLMKSGDQNNINGFFDSLTINGQGDLQITDPSYQDEIQKISNAINDVAKQALEVINNRPLSKVVLIGQSQGGIIAWILANKLSLIKKEPLGALITDSSPFVWLTEPKYIPKHVIVNTPQNDEYFNDSLLNSCDTKLDMIRSSISSDVSGAITFNRFKDSNEHCEQSDAFKLKVAEKLVSVIQNK